VGDAPPPRAVFSPGGGALLYLQSESYEDSLRHGWL